MENLPPGRGITCHADGSPPGGNAVQFSVWQLAEENNQVKNIKARGVQVECTNPHVDVENLYVGYL